MPVLVLITRVIHHCKLYFAVAGSIVYNNNNNNNNNKAVREEVIASQEAATSFKVKRRAENTQ